MHFVSIPFFKKNSNVKGNISKTQHVCGSVAQDSLFFPFRLPIPRKHSNLEIGTRLYSLHSAEWAWQCQFNQEIKGVDVSPFYVLHLLTLWKWFSKGPTRLSWAYFLYKKKERKKLLQCFLEGLHLFGRCSYLRCPLQSPIDSKTAPPTKTCGFYIFVQAQDSLGRQMPFQMR